MSAPIEIVAVWLIWAATVAVMGAILVWVGTVLADSLDDDPWPWVETQAPHPLSYTESEDP